LCNCKTIGPIEIEEEIIEIGKVQKDRDPELGMKIQKSGRTTGLTFGKVNQLNSTIRIRYSAGLATFEDQIWPPTYQKAS
jgi:hypothetical protein